MFRGIGIKIAAVLFWALSGSCSTIFAQEADSVKAGSMLHESVFKQDSMAVAGISVIAGDTLPNSFGALHKADTLITAFPERELTRREKKEARKSAKAGVQGPAPALPQSFKVVSGHKVETVKPDSLIVDSLSTGIHEDSMRFVAGEALDSILLSHGIRPDSLLLAHGIRKDSTVSDSVRYEIFRGVYETMRDSTLTVINTQGGDSLALFTGTVIPDSLLSRREFRAAQRERNRADSTLYLHNPYFKDTLSFNKFKLISMVVPGFGQFYNRDYWKIPVIYGVAGTATYFGFQQHKKYKHYKEIYDYRVAGGFPRDMIDPIQNNMIIHNTARQLLFGAAIGTYIYMVGDAVVRYPSENTRVQTATWLSVICPGAGQVYNKSYWRVPLAVGGLTTFLYVVDWNNRIYQRWKTAFELEADGDPNTISEVPGTDVNTLKTYKDNARRARDLSIILTGVWYLFNIMDAHVDAHLKVFDVSDNLAWKLEPMVDNFYTHATGNVSLVGLSLSYTF